MALPFTGFGPVPVVGGSFSDVASQLGGWAGFNRGVVEGNIARGNAAQENQNRWLANVSALRDQAQQRDIQLELGAQAQARQEAAAARDQANLERQFAFNQEQEKDRLKLGREQIEASTKTAEDRFRFGLQQTQQKIDQQGVNSAVAYRTAKAQADQARDALDEVEGRIKDLQAKQIAEAGKKKPDLTIGGQIRELEKERSKLTTAHNRAENAFQAIDTRIRGMGFDITDTEVVHPPTGKRWSFEGALRKAKGESDAAAGGASMSYPGGLEAAIIASSPATTKRVSFADGSAAGLGESTYHPMTRQDVDVIPPGALYVNPRDGKVYRKR